MNYSLRKNLSYMAMAFYRPKLIVDIFLKEISFLYSVVPLIIFTIWYETLYILGYFIIQSPHSINLITKIFHVSNTQYAFYQIFLFPIVHIVAFIIFFGLIYTISRRLRLYKIDAVKTIFFFIFIFNTIGLLSAVVDTLNIKWESEFLLYIHPFTGIIFLAYLMEFIHKQTEINRWKSLVLCIAPLTIFLAFRVIFLG